MGKVNAIKDPVCGMTVTEKSFYHLQRDGQAYYFCGELCQARFAAPAQPLWGRLKTHLFGPQRKNLQSVRSE